jgi:hypothetical protein
MLMASIVCFVLSGCVLGFIVGWNAGLIVGGDTADAKWRDEAMEHKYGKYNTVTGKWEWITNN